MNRKHVALLAMLVVAVAGVVLATNLSRTDQPAAYVGTTSYVPVFQFTLGDGGDTTVAGTAPADGTAITTGNPNTAWSNMYFYDGGTAGTWESGSDSIFLDDGQVYYDSGKDTSVAGVTTENTGPATTTDPWELSYLDGGISGTWESSSDWIGFDDDNDGVYTPSADTVVDCDGSTTNTAGTCDAHNPGDPLRQTSASDNLCADSLVSPTVVFIDSDGNCNTADGTITILLGSPSGTYNAVGTAWAYVDTDSSTSYTDGEDLYIESVSGSLTYSAAADTTVAGTAPADGTAITTGNPNTAWSNMYFYDGGTAGTWESGSDSIFLDDGQVYYDSGKDTSVAGVTTENTGPATTTDPWELSYLDGGISGTWESSSDWIGFDADANGVYRDALNDIHFTNTGTATDSDAEFVIFQGASCSGTSDTMIWDNTNSYWKANSAPLNWPEGTYTICARAKTGATDGSSIQVSVAPNNIFIASGTLPPITETNGYVQTIDATPPETTITTPSDGGYYNSLSSITGTASDGTSGISSVSVRIYDSSNYWDGTQWVSDANPSANAPWLLASGTTSWSYDTSSISWTDGNSYTVEAKSTNGANDEDTTPASSTFTYDTSAPTVSANPSSQTWTNSAISVTLSATDSGSGVSTLYYNVTASTSSCPAVGGASYTSTTNNPETVTVSTTGEWKICAYASDNLGNIPTSPAEFATYQYDDIEPSATITTPSDGGYYNSLDSITGTASDSDSGIANVYLRISYIDSGTTYYWDGSSWITTSTDIAASYNGADGSWSYDSSSVAWVDGTQYTVTAIPSDNAGNVLTPPISSTFTYDTTPPQLTYVHIESNNANPQYAKVGDTITLTFIADEDLASTPSVTIAGHSVTPTEGDGGDFTHWTATYTMQSIDTEGNVTFSIQYSDLAGNAGADVSETTDGSNVLFDKTRPTATVVYPVDNTYYNTTIQYINGTASDGAGSGIEGIKIKLIQIDESENPQRYWDGSSWVNSGEVIQDAPFINAESSDGYNTWFANVSGISFESGKRYKILMYVNDNAGNDGYSNYLTTSTRFWYDIDPPTFSIDTVASDDVVVSTEAANVQFSISSLSDAYLSKGVDVYLRIYNESGDVVYEDSHTGVTAATDSFTYDMSALPDGGYSAIFIAVDKAGNRMTHTKEFYKFTKNMSELSPLLVDSQTTQLNQVNDWTSVSSMVFATTFGKIQFNQPIDFTDTTTRDALMNLSANFRMNWTYVDLNAAATALKELNKSATITLYDYENYGIKTPMVFMNGEVCPVTVCTSMDGSQSNLGGDAGKRDMQFTVAHWTNYTIDQTSGPRMVYAYAIDSNKNGQLEAGEKIVAVFNETVEIYGSPAVSDVFALDNGTFGTGATLSVSGNKVEITLGASPSVSHEKLAGRDSGATALSVKAGQTGLVRQGTTVPVKDGSEDIATAVVQVSNGAAFSVPSCVDSSMMLSKAGNPSGVFSKYINGKWEDVASFKPLEGYKYFGNETFDMPVYTYTTGCDISEIKIPVSNDWNLLGLNKHGTRKAGDWLWSLTRRSSTEVYVDAIYTTSGTVVGTYNLTARTFNNGGTELNVDPYMAYWVPYAGTGGQMFLGASQ